MIDLERWQIKKPAAAASMRELMETSCLGCGHTTLAGEDYICDADMPGFPQMTNREFIEDQKGNKFQNPKYCFGWHKRQE